MNLSPYVDPKCFDPKLKARSKQEVLRHLAHLATQHPACDLAAESIYQYLLDREDQGSTGFGKGIAIPHARIPGLEQFIIGAAVAPWGVNFDALDKKRVQVFLFILGPPEQVQLHLKILATLSRALVHTGLKRELMGSRSSLIMAESLLRNTTDTTRENQPRENRSHKLMLINVYLPEYLQPILELLVENDIEGATILESDGMGRYISDVPLFASFIGFMTERRTISKTIMTLIPEDKALAILKQIEEVTGDLSTHEGAMVMMLDLALWKGSMKMM